MKNMLIIAAFAAATTAFAAPAHAQYCDQICRDEARDPAYQRAIRSGGYYSGYYNGYYNSYGPPIFYEENNVKRNTARRNHRYYKACPNGDPAVPIDVPCPGTTGYSEAQPAPSSTSGGRYTGSYTGTQTQTYIDGSYLVTIDTDANGVKTTRREPINR